MSSMTMEVKDAPFGNVPTMFTHESIYTEPREIMSRFYIAVFAAPLALMTIVFPMIAHDQESAFWKEYYGDVRALGPHSHQAMHETFYNRSRKMVFDMKWFSLSFSLDGSLARTPAQAYMSSQNISLLRSDVNLTILKEVMANLEKIPDVYALYLTLLTEKNHHRMSEAQATDEVMNLREVLPGFLDAQGSMLFAGNRDADPWHRLRPAIASALEKCDEILHGHRVVPLEADFLIMSTATLRSIHTTETAERSLPDFSETTVNQFMQRRTGDSELAMKQKAVTVQTLNGVNLISLDSYDSNEGITNPLETIERFGIFHHLQITNPNVSVTVDIPDYERRCMRSFKLKPLDAASTVASDFTEYFNAYGHMFPVRTGSALTYPEFTTYADSKKPAATDVKGSTEMKAFIALQNSFDELWANKTSKEQDIWHPTTAINIGDKTYMVAVECDKKHLYVVRKDIQVAGETVYYGIGGDCTGVIAVGQENSNEYMMHHQQRKEYTIDMRLGVWIAHEEHIIKIPCAKYRRYMGGAGTTWHMQGPASTYGVVQRRRLAAQVRKSEMVLMGASKYTTARSAKTSVWTDNDEYSECDNTPESIGHVVELQNILTCDGKPLSCKRADDGIFGHVYVPKTVDCFFSKKPDNAVPALCWRMQSGPPRVEYDTSGMDKLYAGDHDFIESLIHPDDTQSRQQKERRTTFAARGAEQSYTQNYEPVEQSNAGSAAGTVGSGQKPKELIGQPDKMAMLYQGGATILRRLVPGGENETMRLMNESVTSRGPFRYMTCKSAMDTWNNRGFQTISG